LGEELGLYPYDPRGVFPSGQGDEADSETGNGPYRRVWRTYDRFCPGVAGRKRSAETGERKTSSDGSDQDPVPSTEDPGRQSDCPGSGGGIPKIGCRGGLLRRTGEGRKEAGVQPGMRNVMDTGR